MKNRLRQRLSKQKKSNNDQGLTLLECLVAIAVVGISSALIGPMMLLALATRVQNQRAEQALQLAQQEIDAIKVVVERGGNYNTYLSAYPKLATGAAITAARAPNRTAAASLSATDERVPKGVDTDDDPTDTIPAEFAVQVFRTEGREATIDGVPNTPVAFRVGVRVYDNEALQRSLAENRTISTARASLTMTRGEGQRSQRPLAILYADIIRSDRDASLCNYRLYIDSTATNTGLNCS